MVPWVRMLMVCPSCGNKDVRVSDSRVGHGLALKSARHLLTGVGFVSRRRRCKACSHRWQTVELSVTDLLRLRQEARVITTLPARIRDLVSQLQQEVESTP